MALKVLIIVPPLRKKVSFYPPFGAMSMVSLAKKAGYEASLLDLDADRCTEQQALEQIVAFAPDVIGISAVVSTSYKYVKRISSQIRQKLPQAVIVVGGGLAAAAETVLSHSDVDVAVLGEGELTFRDLLQQIDQKAGLNAVKGIVFKQGGQLIHTPARELIKNIDELPFPDYDLLDLDKYVLNINDFLAQDDYGDAQKIDQRVSDPKRSKKFLRINLSRGCVNRCTFCYRNMAGWRSHSFKYIGDLIEQVVNKYNIGHISFGDECFGPTKKWLWDFINMIRERNFDLTYHITGMRVGTADLDIMKALKEIGVWHIQFGFESGSQKILNVMEKNTTVEQNVEAARLVRAVGINTVPFIIIGYPGETRETLYETIGFLKVADLLAKNFRSTLPLAMPGTPLYEYATLRGFISDEDRYLEAISDVEASELSKGNYFINFTDEPDDRVLLWQSLVTDEINKHYQKGATLPELLIKVLKKIRNQGFSTAAVKVLKRLQAKLLAKKYADQGRQPAGPKAVKGEGLRQINQKLRARVACNA